MRDSSRIHLGCTFSLGLLLARGTLATSFQGIVVDSKNAPVANAAVWMLDTAAWPKHRALTDTKGQFHLELLTSEPTGSRRQILVRKAGFDPRTLSVSSLTENTPIVLAPGNFESRIDSVIQTMDLADKVGQMTQGHFDHSSKAYIRSCRLGSVLTSGQGPGANYDEIQRLATSTPRRIPLLYGTDAVHGNAKHAGSTILPHNIGLGATGDTSLLRRLGALTAQEMWAAQSHWNFAPCLAVVRDIRWGRSYESYGERPELVSRLGAAYVKGLQGDGSSTSWGVLACAKHYVADGGTTYGTGSGEKKILNEGDARLAPAELDSIHLPGYLATIQNGVWSIMASFSSVNGTRMHANHALLTDTLKTDFGFDGFVISDWQAINQLPGDYPEQVAAAVNAGLDMAMEPFREVKFTTTLTDLVKSGKVPQSRIDDAVRRILRVKFRQGLFDSATRRTAWDSALGSPQHRATAREAVRKSLVVLKNEGKVLPLPKTGKLIAVVGSHADNPGRQCGGWTLVNGIQKNGWQGSPGAVKGATSILAGMRQVGDTGSVRTSMEGANTVVVVTGEEPYAETDGDDSTLALPPEADKLLAQAQQAHLKTVLVLVSGRPLILDSIALKADAIVEAWLPGSEGAGVADVLFGVVAPTGKLPVTWPASVSQLPLHTGAGKPLYPYGFGLSW